MPKKLIRLLSIRRASVDSGLRYKDLLEAARNGRIETVTLSKRPKISWEALERFIAEANQSTRWQARSGQPPTTVWAERRPKPPVSGETAGTAKAKPNTKFARNKPRAGKRTPQAVVEATV